MVTNVKKSYVDRARHMFKMVSSVAWGNPVMPKHRLMAAWVDPTPQSLGVGSYPLSAVPTAQRRSLIPYPCHEYVSLCPQGAGL